MEFLTKIFSNFEKLLNVKNNITIKKLEIINELFNGIKKFNICAIKPVIMRPIKAISYTLNLSLIFKTENKILPLPKHIVRNRRKWIVAKIKI